MSELAHLEHRINDALQRLEVVERAQIIADRNHTDIAKAITAIIDDDRSTRDVLQELKTDREVRKERNINLDARLAAMEKRIDKIYGLGLWLLTAVGGTLILGLVKFILSGGLSVV